MSTGSRRGRAPTNVIDSTLVVVDVRDQLTAALAGHDGCAYTSPPQPRAQALALVAVLLGCPARVSDEHAASWTTSVAGGRRTITLTPAPH